MKFWSDEGGVRREFPLREGSLIIGRHSSCHVVIPGRNVSKQHLQCYVQNGQITIRDLGSANGTTVNGNPVTSCILKHGDEVALGGYRLVVDTEGAVAAPGPHASPRNFDYEPAGTARVEPAATGGAEPGISFAKEPSEDDTPADGAFIPQAYAPQSLQPQVVSRDGRMYLRDPRTSREVEIVPRGAGPRTDLSGYYAEREAVEKKRNTYLIGGAIAVGLLMIIALALTAGPGEEAEVKGPPPFPQPKYNELTEQSVDLMKAGDFEKATRQLKEAEKGKPTLGVAGILLQIADKWKQSGKGYDEFNWLSVEGPLRDLRDNHWRTAKLREFAKNRIEWIYDRQHQLEIVNQALQLRAAGDPEKALAEFDKLPAEVRNEHRLEVEKTVAACYTKHLQLAKDALNARDWAKAIAAFNTAARYASEPKKTDIEREVRLARKRQQEEQILSDANARYRERTIPSLNAALRLLDAIEEDSPLAPRKAQLRERIRETLDELSREKLSSDALALYRAGKGQEAIQFITENRLSDLYPIRVRIETVTRLLKEAEDAYKKKDYDLAKAKWYAAANEETSSANAYNREAVERLAGLSRSAKDIALEYNRRADAALRDGNAAEARRLYLKAMSWDPLATTGKDGLANLRHLAEVAYNRARDLEFAGGAENRRKAIALYEKVMQYVEEGNKYYTWAKRRHGELTEGTQPEGGTD